MRNYVEYKVVESLIENKNDFISSETCDLLVKFNWVFIIITIVHLTYLGFATYFFVNTAQGCTALKVGFYVTMWYEFIQIFLSSISYWFWRLPYMSLEMKEVIKKQ